MAEAFSETVPAAAADGEEVAATAPAGQGEQADLELTLRPPPVETGVPKGSTAQAAEASGGSTLESQGSSPARPAEEGTAEPGKASSLRFGGLRSLQLHATLGTGTSGRVRLAYHKTRKAWYALKILKKSEIIKIKQYSHVKSEVRILKKIGHPFLVGLCGFHQDAKRLYLLLEYVPGGELFSLLRKEVRFSPDVAKFYTCQIVLALEYLHSLGIVFRDLKPENILIGKDGYAKVTDFGFAKVLSGDRTYTFCGTPEYLAPEIIQSKGHDTSVDWWALGILVYEMLAGYPPFSDENPFGIYQKILSGKVIFPEHVPAAARDFVRKLLKADWTRRLGCQRGGAADVKRHRWFEELDWGTVLARVIPAPWLPPIAAEDDTRNFDEYPDSDGEGGAALSGKAATLFDDLGGF